jgi:UDP-GlcNAc3NAcA epimerase
MKIVTILGARPQFIKAAVVSKEIQKRSSITEIIIHSGQHYDENMSAVFFKEMEIPTPKYLLKMQYTSHGAMTGDMMGKVEQILIDEKPDYVLVYGDTNTTLAGALTARKLNIPLIHVEGGLRNNDLTIPEEVNRIVADRLSSIIFCSTKLAIKNLKAEGFDKFTCNIVKTGDLMNDVVLNYKSKALATSNIFQKLDLGQKEYCLITIHRASNTSKEFIFQVFKALNSIANGIRIILPIHPRTRKALEEFDITLNKNIVLIDPVGYFDMIVLMVNCKNIITDSGGVQREAYSLKKKSLLLMEFTPWKELVDNNFTILTQIDTQSIIDNYKRIDELNPNFKLKLYGNGTTGKQIVTYMLKHFTQKVSANGS